MSDDTSEFERLIDGLDHPDAQLQNQVLDELSEAPDRARPAVLSALSSANARVRRALLRWLDDHLVSEATLPLMRYVFDERERIAEQTGRSMAMSLLFRRARNVDNPEERGRLRAFAEDVAGDPNDDVRRLAMRILAFTGNSRSLDVVEPRTDDEDEDVRQAARKTRDVLRETGGRADDSDDEMSAEQLRRRLVRSAGPLRRQLVRRWRRHPAATDIALEILDRGSDLRFEALQVLLEDPDPAAGARLADLVCEDPEDDKAPLALRLMAKLGDERTTDAHVEAIRRGLHAESVLTRAAACRAAGALGRTEFVAQLIRASQSRDLSVALDAACSLEQLLEDSHHEYLQKLLTALKTNERRRRHNPDDQDRVTLVAHLLSAIRKAVSSSTIGTESLHRTVLDIVAEAAPRHRPLVVTSLQVLMASTPAEGLEEFERWHRRDASALLGLLEGADEPTARRIGELLRRGAPEGMAGLEDAATRLRRRGDVNVAEIVVPLLDRAGTDRAIEQLETIADGDEQPAATEANRVLRRRRNDQDYIDVEFIPRDGEP